MAKLAKPDEELDLPFTAPELAAELVRWLAYLAAERRMSPKTVEAYGRDVRQFLAFLGEHLGHRVTLAALAKLEPLDVRAFMAARRADGISSRSLMRMLAGARSFARFLERSGKGKVGALAAVRAPKLAKTLPKPLGIAAAKRIADTDLRAGGAGARRRGARAALWLRPAHLRGALDHAQGCADAGRQRRDHRYRQG
jgi:integrase/recombinase XerC